MAYDSNRIQEVKQKVSIPMYFYNIILVHRADYYGDYTVDFDSKPVAKCPLHDEDTPSMRFYEETNTFFCFGCRKGGDVIELHRQHTFVMSDVIPSFDEAVDYLYDFFIRGNENAKVIKLKGKMNESEQLSTAVDTARYTKYTTMLGEQLNVDTDLSCESKKKIWKALDETDILLSKNMISAIDAIAYIKNVVSNEVT